MTPSPPQIGRPTARRRPRRPHRPDRSYRPVTLVVLALLVAPLAVACGGDTEGRTRPSGDAVWLAPESGGLGRADLRRLERAGLTDVFVEAGEVVWRGAVPEVEGALRRPARRLPEGSPVTLVLGGSLAGGAYDPVRAAEVLADAAEDLRLRAGARGLVPRGVHLALGAELGGDLGRYHETVRHLRAILPRSVALSVAYEPGWARVDGGDDLARAADFLVVSAHGHRPDDPDDPTAWSSETVAQALAPVGDLEVPFLVVVRGLGWASHLGSEGPPLDTTTRIGLKPLVDDPDLRWVANASLGETLGRVAYTFQVTQPTRVGDWNLAAGEQIRVVRVAPGQIQELDRQLGERFAGYRGRLFYRLPDPAEKLTPDADELAAAFAHQPASPVLRARVVVNSRSANRAVLGVELVNASSQDTDLAVTDWNYVEVRASEGYLRRVEVGEFTRYDNWRGDQPARPGTPGWREPDAVRFYVPMVGGDERLTGGEVELLFPASAGGSGRRATVRVGGQFLLPDGRILELPTVEKPLDELPRFR